MSRDVKMFTACNHFVNDVYYESQICPRCYGKGFYFDIYLDTTGSPILSESSSKLQQEVLKIMIENKGDNQFHSEWGLDVNDRLVGNKNMAFMTTKIELLIRQTLQYLQRVQSGENAVWDNMSQEETLSSIDSIEVLPVGKTGYQVKIKVTNISGQTIVQSLIL